MNPEMFKVITMLLIGAIALLIVAVVIQHFIIKELDATVEELDTDIEPPACVSWTDAEWSDLNE